MAEPLKNLLSRGLLSRLASDIKSAYKPFQVDAFIESTIDDTWDGLELKDRTYRVGLTMGKYLPQEYGAAIGIIDKVVMNYGTWLDGFAWFFPVFVEIYGQDEANWDVSMAALERYTSYASAEMAVRPFIIK